MSQGTRRKQDKVIDARRRLLWEELLQPVRTVPSGVIESEDIDDNFTPMATLRGKACELISLWRYCLAELERSLHKPLLDEGNGAALAIASRDLAELIEVEARRSELRGLLEQIAEAGSAAESPEHRSVAG